MTDETDVDVTPAKPKRRLKTILMIVGPVALVSVGLVGAVVKVPMLHGVWCKKVGVLCVKEPEKPVVVVAPNHCPDFRLRGSMRARGGDEPTWTMNADVSGKISLKHDATETAGKSSVVCFGTEFLASFTDMTNEVTYQCLGTIDGKAYASTCNSSKAALNDITGTFQN